MLFYFRLNLLVLYILLLQISTAFLVFYTLGRSDKYDKENNAECGGYQLGAYEKVKEGSLDSTRKEKMGWLIYTRNEKKKRLINRQFT